jgi:hypothetical protein
MHTSLFVFGDEYGTMPVKDDDGPFLVATVALRAPLLTDTETSGHPGSVAEKLCEIGALVHVAYAIPSVSYGEMFLAKIARIDTLARASFVKDGRNARFWNEYGVRIRNHVWVNCMGASVSAAVANAALMGRIEEIHVHLDQKTLSAESLATFCAAVARIPENLKGILLRFPNSVGARTALNDVQACTPKLAVTWRGTEDQHELAFGLKLAHLVAYHAGKAFEASRKNDPLEFLTKRHVNAASKDMTPVLLQDLAHRDA